MAIEKNKLVCEKIIKHYKSKPILLGINIEVEQGTCVGLLGPNGAGKTTLFSIVAGLLKPDDGKVYLNNLDISDYPIYKRARLGIGYLPQESSIFKGLTVEQNLSCVLEMTTPDSEERQHKIDMLLDEFSISHLRQSPALILSGGERRRVEIARALSLSPKFLLLDEPLAGIDPIAMTEIKELISHLKTKNIGLLITDHNVRETLDVIEHAYVINNGQILTHGTPDEIINHKDVRRVYLGERFDR